MPEPEQPTLPRRAGIEARTQTRYRCYDRTIVRFAIRPSYQNYFALVHDVSINGIGFLIDRPLEPGTVLALQMLGRLEETTVVRTAQVMHVRRHLPIADAPWVKKKPWLKSLLWFFTGEEDETELEYVYLVGCRFNPPMSVEELEDLCGPQITNGTRVDADSADVRG